MKTLNGGYTLVELLVTLALTGLIFTIAGTAIYQLHTVSDYGNDRLTVQHEMQNARHWFSRDAQQACSAEGGSSLTLVMIDGSSISYELSGDTLQRVSGANGIPLVRHVSELNFLVQERLVTLNITADMPADPEESVQSSYTIYLRSMP